MIRFLDQRAFICAGSGARRADGGRSVPVLQLARTAAGTMG